MATITGNQLIGFESHEGKGVAFNAINPATDENLPINFYEATDNQLEAAMIKASSAFSKYKKKSPEQKAAFLEQIAAEIEALDNQLIEICNQETALPEQRLKGERGRTCNQLRLFASVVREGSWVGARIDTAQPTRQPIPKSDIRLMHVPLGPVAVFGASNFPLAFSVAGGDTASALAAGCPVIVKGHPAHPNTSELIGKAIQEAAKKSEMPDGIFSLLQGKANETSIKLITHPVIKAVGFTGSFNGGKALYDAVQKRDTPIPVYAEMGSTNPMFILPEAMKKRGESIAQGLAGSVTLGVGQFCTNPGMVFFQDIDNHSIAFSNTLSQAIENHSGGTMLTNGILNAYKKGTEILEKTEGVDLSAKSKVASGAIPTVFETDVSSLSNQPIISQEVFGPSTVIIKGNTKEDLLKAAEELEGHLTVTVHADESDIIEYAELFEILREKAGRMILNGFPTGVEVCHSMMHGGPYPATLDNRSTSVGTLAIMRFVRPMSFQDFPQNLLPDELKDGNPLGIIRLVDGEMKR